MPESIFLHVGAHRTGTTHFQGALNANARRLENKGIRFQKLQEIPGYRRLLIRLRRALEQLNGAGADQVSAELAALYRRILAERAGAETLLLSYEGHLGTMGLHFSNGLYPQHATMAAEIGKIFAGRDLKIGLSIRAYDQHVESTYKYNVRLGYSKTFDEYVSGADLKYISWVPIVEDLIASFGRDAVVVWSLEAYIAEPARFFTWLLRQVRGAAAAIPRIKVGEAHKNASASGAALDIAVASNRVLEDVIKRRDLRRQVVVRLNKITERALPPPQFAKPVLLSDELRRDLQAKYAADLETIARLLPSTSYLVPPVKKPPPEARQQAARRRSWLSRLSLSRA